MGKSQIVVFLTCTTIAVNKIIFDKKTVKINKIESSSWLEINRLDTQTIF